MLRVLLFAQGQILITIFFSLSQLISQILDLLLEVLDGKGQLQFRLGDGLGEGADGDFTLLNLSLEGLGEVLDFVLMCLVKLIDFLIGLFFTDNRGTFSISKALHDSLVVHLHLLLLFLLLLELESHELILLLGHGCILQSLALDRVVVAFQFLHYLF